MEVSSELGTQHGTPYQTNKIHYLEPLSFPHPLDV